MSKISFRPDYSNQLWLVDDNASFSFSWGPHTFTFSQTGIAISTEVDLDISEQEAIVRCLTFDDPSFVPLWQSLSPDLHRTVERIVEQILEAAMTADHCIRQSPKGIRLSPLRFEERFVNQSQSFPVVYWRFSDEERECLKPIYENLSENAKRVYDKGIMIPMPVSFERRQIYLENDEVKEIGSRLGKPSKIEPHRLLYAIAWENYIDRSFDSAILVLATSIETALKWWLNKQGDEITRFLITNIQSPPVEQLYTCARNNTDIELPGVFTDWLVRLRKTRNDIAHKPISKKIDNLEIARWFAVGEAILRSISGHNNDPLVGFLVEPTGEKAAEKFPPNSRGVVLRREELYGENSLHVLLDTGETWRFSTDACKKCRDQDFW